jgi:hypothetical protein
VCQVRVQGQGKGWAFLYDPHAGVPTAMDAAFVSLWLSEPAFEIEIVLRPSGLACADKQTRLETGHHLAHVTRNLVVSVALKLPPQLGEPCLPFANRAAAGIKRGGHLLHRLYLAADRRLVCLYGGRAAVDAVGQTPQLVVSAPPFFAARFRWSEARTSPRASAMRRPAG